VDIQEGQYRVSDDAVMVFGLVTGRDRATGDQHTAEIFWVFRLRDGLVASMQAFRVSSPDQLEAPRLAASTAAPSKAA
jgi:hypothetical protein